MPARGPLGSLSFPAETAHQAPETLTIEFERDWIDATNVSEETLKQLLKTDKALRFDWENKWLRGDQYAHMLNHLEEYGRHFGMPKLAEKQHPENIYLEPQSKSDVFLNGSAIN